MSIGHQQFFAGDFRERRGCFKRANMGLSLRNPLLLGLKGSHMEKQPFYSLRQTHMELPCARVNPELDANGDGTLSREEFEAMMGR